jgi:hypothetical protein
MSRKNRKSIVITVRLFEDDQDEAKALVVYRQGREAGLTNAQIITRALLALAKHPLPQRAEPLAAQLQDSIEDMRRLIEKLSNGQITVNQNGKPESIGGDEQLDASLVASLKNRATPGMRTDK